MEYAPKRPGSITFLLVGLVLLVTVAGLFVVLVRCVECPLRQDMGATAEPAWPCPLCGELYVGKATLWRKWTWKPKTPKDWLELPAEKRPKDWSIRETYDDKDLYDRLHQELEKNASDEKPKLPEEKK